MQPGARRINLDMAPSPGRLRGQMRFLATASGSAALLTRNPGRAYAQRRVPDEPAWREGKPTGDGTMATLREAVSQLDAAIQHLEQALESGAGSDDPEAARWRAALEQANRRNEELTAVADQVAQRLDRAVARVTAILES